MFHVLRHADRPRSTSRTIKFEGEAYGTSVSFFAVDNDPGEGPDPHVHPYPETWIVRSGEVEFNVDGRRIKAGPGDIVVVEAGVPHGFKNIGGGRLNAVCIHASKRIMQEFVQAAAPTD